MKDVSIRIPGQVPSKKNNKRIAKNRATGRAFIISSQVYMDWHESSMWSLKRYRGILRDGPKYIELVFFNKNRMRHDLDNMASSVLDLLVDAGVIEDDACNVVPVMKLGYGGVDKNNPRVEIYIEDIGNDET